MAAHTCPDCNSALPTRTIKVSTRACWKCHKRTKFATLHKGHHFLILDLLTKEEAEFAKENGVILERRHSATVQRRYTANVCPNCDQVQGHHYLEQEDAFPEYNTQIREIHRRIAQGPCDTCSICNCETHGPYFNYTGEAPCPECLRATESVP